MSSFLVVRARTVLRIIRKLKLDKASGPDGMPVRIFVECCKELAPAIAVLVRFLLRSRMWPQIWRLHRIHPLYKKGAVSNATNYRGVHLTNILSKVAERVIGSLLGPYFDQADAFGVDQWAFRPKRSCRDLVALLVSRWLWAMDNGFKVAIYLSDIAGAFDKVDRDILLKRLKSAGLQDAMLDFLYSYLAPREAVVVVQGKESHRYRICNEIFQGTVLGPPLWNVFFKSIDDIIKCCTFKLAKFADDLTAYKNFESSLSNEHILEDMEECQLAAHNWGVVNRVQFDAGKEHFCILHKMNCYGETFKLLGTLLDPKLTMEDEIRRIQKKARPKVKAILATRNYYSLSDMMQQYKSHALCHLESSCCAIYHAAQTHLNTLDAIQESFVHELGLTHQDAFLEFNLAPLNLRRDIAVLGLLHKIQLGEAHPDFNSLFPKESAQYFPTRHAAKRHGRQFREIAGNSYYFNQSIFSATKIYNVLPEYVVYAESVQVFQSLLTKDAKFACRTNRPEWSRMYNNRNYGWR